MRTWSFQTFSYTREITQDQLDSLLKYWNSNDYYELYTHNCSTLAEESWNKLFPFDIISHNALINDPFYDMPLFLKYSIALKSGYDPNYNQTMLDILQKFNNRSNN